MGGVVAVEDGDELAIGVAHRMVDVAGLGALVVRTDDVAATAGLGEVAELLAPPVIEDPDVHLIARPVDVERRQHGRAHQVQRLVVAGYVDVDGGPVRRVGRHRHRLAVQRIGRLHIGQDQQRAGVDLRRDQTDAQEPLKETVERQRVGGAPVEVARGDDGGEHRQHEAGAARLEAVDDQEGRDADPGQDRLIGGPHRHGDEHQREQRRE